MTWGSKTPTGTTPHSTVLKRFLFSHSHAIGGPMRGAKGRRSVREPRLSNAGTAAREAQPLENSIIIN